MLKKKKRIYLTLGRRFVILASVTFLLPLAIFACFSSRNYSDGINLKLQQMTDSTLALVDKNIDYIIYDIESTSALITTNASVQSLLLENGPQYSLAYRRKERSVWNTVINVTNNKDFLDIIFLANEHNAITKYRSSLAGEPIENYATLIASDWYKDLLSLRGKGAWYSGAEIPGFSSNLLVYAKAVLNMNNPETIGILLAGIGDSPFSRILKIFRSTLMPRFLSRKTGIPSTNILLQLKNFRLHCLQWRNRLCSIRMESLNLQKNIMCVMSTIILLDGKLPALFHIRHFYWNGKIPAVQSLPSVSC